MKEYIFNTISTFEEALKLTDQINTYIHNNFKGEILAILTANTDLNGTIKSVNVNIFNSLFDANDFINTKMYDHNISIEAYIIDLNKNLYVSMISKNYDSLSYYRCATCRIHELDSNMKFIARYLFDTKCKISLHDAKD